MLTTDFPAQSPVSADNSRGGGGGAGEAEGGGGSGEAEGGGDSGGKGAAASHVHVDIW